MVKFLDGATLLGTETLPSTGGKVAFSTSALIVGSHSITALYEGSSAYTGSTSPVFSESIEKATTTTKLTSSLNPSKYSQSVTLTAVVTPEFWGIPNSTVTFKDGTTILGTVTLASGEAKLTTHMLSVGSHSLTAVYGGGRTSTAALRSVDGNSGAGDDHNHGYLFRQSVYLWRECDLHGNSHPLRHRYADGLGQVP